jgi:hypothetical protein
MITRFFLLAALCTISSLQASETTPDEKLIFGYEPFFSTHYIEAVKTANLQRPMAITNVIKREEYNTLQKNSTLCYARRAAVLDTAYRLIAFANNEEKTKYYEVYSDYHTKLDTIAASISASISNLDLLLPDSSILRHIQWVREIHVEMKKNGNTYDNKTVIKLIDNTNLEVSPDLSNVLIRHLAAHKKIPFATFSLDNVVTAVYRVHHT